METNRGREGIEAKEGGKMTQERAAVAGKRDLYCHAMGGFCVAAMPGGGYDYFPAGQPPHVVSDGGIKKVGHIVERYVLMARGGQYDIATWKRILVDEV